MPLKTFMGMIYKETNIEKVNQLQLEIKKANDAYREGKPIMSDYAYDLHVERLRELDPNNDWFKRGVQDSIPKSRKETLPIQLPSLNKCKSLDEIAEWLQKHLKQFRHVQDWKFVELIITPKFDGITILEDFESQKAWTRGNGIIGQQCKDHISETSRPEWYDGFFTGAAYRGEAIITNADWKMFKRTFPEYKNPRNTVAGMMNGDYCKDVPYHFITIIPYDLYTPMNLHKSEQLDHFVEISARPCPYYKTNFLSLTEGYLRNIYDEWIKDYPIDGLVIDIDSWMFREGVEVNGNPSYSRAYKHPLFSEKKKTKIISVERSINRHGVVTPVCVIEPVELAGAEISRVNGINMSYVYDWGLIPGTEVTVVRSGEVIPKIVVVKGTKIPFREEFKSNKEYEKKYSSQLQARKDQLQSIDYKVSGEMEMFMDETCTCPFCKSTLVWDKTFTNLKCQNQDCEEIKIQKNIDFFRILGMEDFGGESIRNLYNLGKLTIEEIFNVDTVWLSAQEGWGESSANQFGEELNRLQTIGVPYAKYLHATGYFENLGEKTLQLIVNEFPHSINFLEIAKIRGVGELTAVKYVEGLKKCSESEFSKVLVKISYIQSPKPQEGILNGTVIVFSGLRDNELAAELQKRGAEISDNFTKKTNLLIIKNRDKITSKMTQAEKQGTTVYTREELIEKLNSL